jgi:CO/xanthine dehydrogenase FAD-binding subunit
VRFQYVRPRTLAEAFGVCADHGRNASLLAGGTDLLVRLRLGHIAPAVVVDIKRVRDLSASIVETDSMIRIGAGAVMTDIGAHAGIGRHFPALIESARVVGSVQIRNRATLAGNICNASPAADTAPALLVYEARVNLVSAAGSRQVPLNGFFTGPGRTVLAAGEIVESIDLPLPRVAAGAAFGRITRRYGVDLATINLCCLVTASGETRVAFGAVGPRPFVVEDLTGTLADDSSSRRDAVLAEMIAQAAPISDVRADRDYRLAMLDVMSRRALATAIARLGAHGREPDA